MRLKTFNRTSMESKPIFKLGLPISAFAFNRTSMESKPAFHLQRGPHLHFAGQIDRPLQSLECQFGKVAPDIWLIPISNIGMDPARLCL